MNFLCVCLYKDVSKTENLGVGHYTADTHLTEQGVNTAKSRMHVD